MITPAYTGIIAHRRRAGWADDWAADFDGSSDFLYQNSYSNYADTRTGGRTLSLWVTFDDVTKPSEFFGGNHGSFGTNYGFWRLRFRGSANNDLQLQARNNGVAGTPVKRWNFTPSNGTLYNIVIVNTGAGNVAYVNTAALSVKQDDGGITAFWWGDTGLNSGAFFNTGGVVISSVPTATVFHNGTINEVTYWSQGFDSSDRSELYNSGVPADPTTHTAAADLQNYWGFEQSLADSQASDDWTDGGSITYVAT